MITLLIICLLAGCIGSILQGMIGIGTGIIIVPLLSFMLPALGMTSNEAMHIALGTSMAAIALNSVTALISHHKKGNISWDLFKKIIGFSLLGASLGAVSASALPGHYLEIFYGLFLLGLALYMGYKRQSNDGIDTIPAIPQTTLAAGGFGIGFIASIVGSGGGVLMVPFLHAKKVKMRYNVGTSTLLGLPVAVMGALTYSLIGVSKITLPYTIGFLHWPALCAISLAGIISAPLGVKLATHLPSHIVQRIFALCIGIIGLKMCLFF